MDVSDAERQFIEAMREDRQSPKDDFRLEGEYRDGVWEMKAFGGCQVRKGRWRYI